jgi:TatA/E family protein of Tat protein translocase
MLDVGLPELMLILVVILIVFGPGKLPEVGRGLGKAIGEFRRFTSGAGLLEALEERERAVPATPPAMQRCVTCGTTNALSSRFCSNCGRELTNESATSQPA